MSAISSLHFVLGLIRLIDGDLVWNSIDCFVPGPCLGPSGFMRSNSQLFFSFSLLAIDLVGLLASFHFCAHLLCILFSSEHFYMLFSSLWYFIFTQKILFLTGVSGFCSVSSRRADGVAACSFLLLCISQNDLCLVFLFSLLA